MKPHPRCELCGSNPPEQIHCWILDFYDEDDAPTPEDVGMPYMACKHCPVTAEECPDCDGEGYFDFVDDDGNDDEKDCPTCRGWGVLPPKGEAP